MVVVLYLTQNIIYQLCLLIYIEYIELTCYVYAIFFFRCKSSYIYKIKAYSGYVVYECLYSNRKCVSCNFYYSNFMFNFIYFTAMTLKFKKKKIENKNTEKYYGVKTNWCYCSFM